MYAGRPVGGEGDQHCEDALVGFARDSSCKCAGGETHVLVVVVEAYLSDLHASGLLEVAPHRVDHTNIILLISCSEVGKLRTL